MYVFSFYFMKNYNPNEEKMELTDYYYVYHFKYLIKIN